MGSHFLGSYCIYYIKLLILIFGLTLVPLFLRLSSMHTFHHALLIFVATLPSCDVIIIANTWTNHASSSSRDVITMIFYQRPITTRHLYVTSLGCPPITIIACCLVCNLLLLMSLSQFCYLHLLTMHIYISYLLIIQMY